VTSVLSLLLAAEVTEKKILWGQEDPMKQCH